MGWGIDGLSQISRCPTTLVQDGKITGVNYTATDRYCIDGQRLIATTDSYVTNPNDATKKIYSSTAAYGANLTEYKTELANFAKIISYGAIAYPSGGTGPAYFKVWTKGGQIIEYGNTADSRIEAAGIATVRTWGVNKISDTKGNTITISYIEDNPNGEAYVSRIDYTGNASSTPVLTPYASVQFVYETRADTTTNYVAGLVIKSTKRMTNVRTYNGTTLIKDYRLTYTNNGTNHFNTSNVADGSLLTKLQECDGAATPVCQNPTNLTWTIAAVNANTFAAAQNWVSGLTIQAAGDINGDGRADVIATNTSGQRVFALSTGTAFSSPTVLETSSVGVFMGDINGDGLSDLIYTDGTIRLSTGNGFGASQTWVSGITIQAMGDINGDGRADISGTNASGQRLFALSTGSAFSSPNVIESSTTNTFLGDVNGDGLADLIYANGTVRLSTGSGFGALQTWASGMTVKAVGDINGDGRADIAAINTNDQNNLYLAESSGQSFVNTSILVYSTRVTHTTQSCYQYVQCGGFGIPRTCCVGPTTITTYTYSEPSTPMYADVNGDNYSDLLFSTGTVQLYFSNVPDTLTLIKDGLGTITTISYKKLSDPTVYTAETGAVYPVRDILPAVPLYVVSSYTSSDGTGGVVTTNYNYGGLKAELTGRGSLGFRYVKESSPDSNISLTTFYKQDY